MKKWSLLMISMSALVVLLYGVFGTSTVFGVTTVTVRGNLNKVIPGPKLVPLAGQQVNVTCGSINKTATTDGNGLYTATFSEVGCSAYSSASARSNYNASIITRQVSVSGEGRATIDLTF